MAEKWDETANDSPEVVYEGFSPPSTHPQDMINAASSSFVSSDCNSDGALVAQAGGYMPSGPMVEEQHPIHGEGSHHEEVERTRLCFVCCNPVSEKNYESIKASMNHSHAPLLVLLTDVLGYKLEEGRLHSQVVCKACYHLLDIIDELQQTLTESKTDVRTKFLETVQKLKLKYPRTDKMLKPRCLRCIQMSQTSARKRGRGRGWKSRSEDISKGRGRGRGRGRARSRSEDGHDPGSDNDSEGQGYWSEDIRDGALPSKSHLPQTYLDTSKPDFSPMLELSGHQSKSSLTTECCLWNSTTENKNSLNNNYFVSQHDFESDDKQKKCGSNDSFLYDSSDICLEDNYGEEFQRKYCKDCLNVQHCYSCNRGDSGVFYQYCETCLMCQGAFIPWGSNVSISFVGNPCSICNIQAQTFVIEGKRNIISFGLLDEEDELEKTFGKVHREIGIIPKMFTEGTQAEVSISLSYLRNDLPINYDVSVKKELHDGDHKEFVEGEVKVCKNSVSRPVNALDSKKDVIEHVHNIEKNVREELESNTQQHCSTVTCSTKSTDSIFISEINQDGMVSKNNSDIGIGRVTCIMEDIIESSVVDHSYIEVTEPLTVELDVTKKFDKGSGSLCDMSSSTEKCLPGVKVFETGVKAISDKVTDISIGICLAEKNHKQDITTKRSGVEHEINQDTAVSIKTKHSNFHKEDSKQELLVICNDAAVELVERKNEKDHPICELCGEIFDYSESSHSYANISNEGSVFACKLCSVKVVKVNFKENSKINRDDKHYKYDTYQENISDETEMHKGILGSENTCSESRTFVCEVCGDSFSILHEFSSHQKLHIDDQFVDENKAVGQSVTCIKHVFEETDVDHSYIEVTDTLSNNSDDNNKVDSGIVQNICLSGDVSPTKTKSNFDDRKKALSDIFTDISSQPWLGKRQRKPTTKAKEMVEEELSCGSEKKNKNCHTGDSNKEQVILDDSTSVEPNSKGNFRDYRYICEFCGKKFNSLGGFRYHVEGHGASEAKLFTCNLCSYKTRRKADLRKHSVIHTGEKKYKCEVCGQEFSVNSSYTRHMRIHSGEKPYKCIMCGKDFRSGGTLKQHMVKHSGTRNFVCEVCGSSFSLRHHYTAHWKLHSGDLPFKCKVCSVAFRNYSALLHHRKKNHPREETKRMKNLKMKVMQVDDLKVSERHNILEHSVDVLQQAMEAAVDSVNDCVESYTQTVSVNNGICNTVASEIVDNIICKDSTVLVHENLPEEVFHKGNAINDDLHGTQTGIISTIEISNSVPLTLEDNERQPSVKKSIDNSFYCEDRLQNAGEFIVVNNEEQSVPNLKTEHVKVVHPTNDDNSPMYIVLSDIQAQDSQLYIVLDKDPHVSD